MNIKTLFTKLALVALIGTFAALPTFAANAQHSFRGGRVEIQSSKSFEDVADSINKLVAKNGMMVMAEVDQGKMLSMTGLKLQAKLFLLGNPNVGKQLFEQDRAVGLYIPLRVFVYTDADGKTFVAYDEPSKLLSQFNNEKISMVAQMLDQKIGGLAKMAAE